jgi:hypothetical protein
MINVSIDKDKSPGVAAEEIIRRTISICARILRISDAKYLVRIAFDTTENVTAFAHGGEMPQDGTRTYACVTHYRKHSFMAVSLNDIGTVLLSICHEMVHVAQFIWGRLRMLSNGDKWFEGIIYKRSFPYSRLPHEREAFELETQLLEAVYRELSFTHSCKKIANEVRNNLGPASGPQGRN